MGWRYGYMQLNVRRASIDHAIKFYKSNNIPIGKFATDVHFEGGDFLILEAGMALIGHCGERSEAAGSE